MTYVTAAEAAKTIRQTLKKTHGWNATKISVRSSTYSMGSSITVQIHDPDIPLAPVKEIAEAHQNVRYCEASGEILSGGNRYVSVEYSGRANAAAAEKISDKVGDAMASLSDAGGGFAKVMPGIDLQWEGHEWVVWTGNTPGRRIWRGCTPQDVAPAVYAAFVNAPPAEEAEVAEEAPAPFTVIPGGA